MQPPSRLLRMSPVPGCHPSRVVQLNGNSAPSVGSASHRGTSPVAGHPLRVTNSREIQQQVQQQLQSIQTMQSLSVFPVDGASEPPPPYPMGSAANPPPSYSQSVAMRQSPTLSSTSSDYRTLSDYRRSPAPPLSNHLLQYQVMSNQMQNQPSPIPSPASSMMSTSSRSSIQAWSARQAKTHSPVIMQSVKSTQVQKPVLQTATAVAALETATPQPQVSVMSAKANVMHGIATGVVTASPQVETCTAPPPPPPSYEFSIQQKQQQQQHRPLPMTPSPSPVIMNNNNNSPLTVQRTLSPPSVIDSNGLMLPPPPPYPSSAVSAHAAEMSHQQQQQMVCGTAMSAKPLPVIQTAKVVANNNSLVRTIESKPPLQRKYSPLTSETGSSASRSESPISDSQTVSGSSPLSFSAADASQSTLATVATDSGIGYESSGSALANSYGKEHHTSPKPERRHLSQAKEEARRESLIRNCPPSAFKFFMEQHIENVIKNFEQRRRRQMQLEQELVQV